MASRRSLSAGGISGGLRPNGPLIDRTPACSNCEEVQAQSNPRIRPHKLQHHGKASAVIIVGVMFSAFLFVFVSYSDRMGAWEPKSPIEISGETELAEHELVTGSGTEADPYVITGYEISGSAYAGISISGTVSYIVIVDVYVWPDTGSITSAIYLDDVSNVTVADSVLEGTEFGIEVQYSDNVTIQSNSIDNCHDQIELRECEFCRIMDNVMTNGWVGIGLFSLASSDIDGNTLDGFAYEGVYSWYVGECSISSNRISNCSASAIFMDYSSYNCTIFSNVLIDNDDSSYRNTAGGVFLDGCTGMLIYHNSFYRNSPAHAYDFGVTGNSWNLSSPTGGNYWDDYSGVDGDKDGFGDTPYAFDEGAEDALPLMVAPGSETPIPEFTTVVAPVLAVLAMFLLVRRRR